MKAIRFHPGLTILLLCLFFPSAGHSSGKLKIVTANIWSGLDYKGIFSMGEYESPGRRQERLSLLIKNLRDLDPDIVFLQEVNDISSAAERIADSLGYDEIHFAVNPGIKIASYGIPSNLQEGIVILAKKAYRLSKADVVKLSGPFGIFSDNFSFQAEEAVFMLAGKIIVGDTPFYLANIHLSYSPDPVYIRKLAESGKLQNLQADIKDVLKTVDERARRRQSEFEVLKSYLSEMALKYPLIISGDFNSSPEEKEMASFVKGLRLTDASISQNSLGGYTWDPENNENIAWSADAADRKEADDYDRLCAAYDNYARRIDYILLSDRFSSSDVTGYQIIKDNSAKGLHFSDHFAVAAEINTENAAEKSEKFSPLFRQLEGSSVEPLPLLAYDSDLGVGYGVKVFFLNQLNLSESFDLIAFNTTKGERWYRFTYSMPDLERRQGKIYSLAVDFVADYDKYIRNNYFRKNLRQDGKRYESYTKEPLDLNITFSRGFRVDLVGQAGVRFKKIWSYNFERDGEMAALAGDVNNTSITYHSLFLNLRYDTRNSFINPESGIVLQGEGEYAVKSSETNLHFSRYAGLFQYYTIAFYPKTIFAARFMLQSISGDNIPLQAMLAMGGNNTLRGFQQDRYLGKALALVNAELRYPIYKRLTGIAGIDAGRAFRQVGLLSLSGWNASPVAGLRLNMDNFIVRLDAGFGPDNLGVYFNFSHLF